MQHANFLFLRVFSTSAPRSVPPSLLRRSSLLSRLHCAVNINIPNPSIVWSALQDIENSEFRHDGSQSILDRYLLRRVFMALVHAPPSVESFRRLLYLVKMLEYLQGDNLKHVPFPGRLYSLLMFHASRLEVSHSKDALQSSMEGASEILGIRRLIEFPPRQYELVTLNLLLQVTAKFEQWRDFDMISIKMLEAGMTGDGYTWAARIQRAAKMQRSNTTCLMDEFARALWWEMERRVSNLAVPPVGVEVWNLVIMSLITRGNLGDADRLYTVMKLQKTILLSSITSLPSDIQNHDILIMPPLPDHLTRSHLLSGYAYHGQYENMLRVILEIHSAPSQASGSGSRRGALNMENFEQIFRGFVRHVRDRSTVLRDEAEIFNIKGKGALNRVMNMIDNTIGNDLPEDAHWNLENLETIFKLFLQLRPKPANSFMTGFTDTPHFPHYNTKPTNQNIQALAVQCRAPTPSAVSNVLQAFMKATGDDWEKCLEVWKRMKAKFEPVPLQTSLEGGDQQIDSRLNAELSELSGRGWTGWETDEKTNRMVQRWLEKSRLTKRVEA